CIAFVLSVLLTNRRAPTSRLFPYTTLFRSAATIGNHDFDAGIEGLVKQMVHADFPFLIANYDMKDTLLKGKTKPYHIFEKSKVKDRKSTRLNSSHVKISYAVFCLKKKK